MAPQEDPDLFRDSVLPRSPSERGWFGSRLDDLIAAVRLNRALDVAIRESRLNRATDATFENETRPHQ